MEYAEKWVSFCAAYGIDPSEPVAKVVQRFDEQGELLERSEVERIEAVVAAWRATDDARVLMEGKK